MNIFLKKLKVYFIPHEENDYEPHFFATTSILFISGAIVFVFLVSILQYVAISKGGDSLASVISSTLVDITNEDRIAYGKGTLAVNPTLVRAAQAKADDMAAKSYFAHTSPEGVTPWHWLEQAGYTFSYAGENLAVNFSDSINVGDAWMNSPGHKANIVNEHFTEIGIATAQGVYKGDQTTFVVQFFGKPRDVRVVHTGEIVIKKETRQVEKTKSLAVIPLATTTLAVTTPGKEVAGALIETVVVDDMFVAVKNNTATETQSVPTMSVPEGSLFARLLVSPHTTLVYVYAVFGVLIVLALALDTFIEIRRQHPLHIVYALLLWTLLFVLLYAAGAYIFPKVVILEGAF
jgi:uncharacterized protein YkwD